MGIELVTSEGRDPLSLLGEMVDTLALNVVPTRRTAMLRPSADRAWIPRENRRPAAPSRRGPASNRP
jgi:hypothetical protein